MAKVIKKLRVYYQTNTTNESFLEVYFMLKNLGIKNNKFFLKLYDKDLMNVDPFDPNLSIETKTKIRRECTRNYWYFIRECVRIPVPGGKKPYQLHRGNLALSYCLLNNLNTIEILPRQNGKTIAAVVFYLWLFNFATKNSQMSFMNKKYEDSRMNLRRLKEIRDCLPEYLKLENAGDTNNITRLESITSRNVILAKGTATDVQSADKRIVGLKSL